MKRHILSLISVAFACAFGFAACTVDRTESGETASQSDALSLAERKLAEPDAQLLRSFLEQRGFALDVEQASQGDVGTTPILGIRFVKPDGSTAQLVFVLEGNQATRTVIAAVPTGSNMPDALYAVADGKVVETTLDNNAAQEEQYGCCPDLVAFMCWLGCGGNYCCASNCCCGPGSCK